MIGDCRDCIFWKAPAPGWGEGQCRRFAPKGYKLEFADGHYETRWPRTQADDFCGEFERGPNIKEGGA